MPFKEGHFGYHGWYKHHLNRNQIKSSYYTKINLIIHLLYKLLVTGAISNMETISIFVRLNNVHVSVVTRWFRYFRGEFLQGRICTSSPQPDRSPIVFTVDRPKNWSNLASNRVCKIIRTGQLLFLKTLQEKGFLKAWGVKMKKYHLKQ